MHSTRGSHRCTQNVTCRWGVSECCRYSTWFQLSGLQNWSLRRCCRRTGGPAWTTWKTNSRDSANSRRPSPAFVRPSNVTERWKTRQIRGTLHMFSELSAWPRRGSSDLQTQPSNGLTVCGKGYSAPSPNGLVRGKPVGLATTKFCGASPEVCSVAAWRVATGGVEGCKGGCSESVSDLDLRAPRSA